MGQANVAAVYLIHGTFCGNDLLGVLTELARVAPHASERMRRVVKSAFDAVLGEVSNFTHGFAGRLERGLSAGAERTIPVRRFNWASPNTHIARADGAVRLIDELARFSNTIQPPAPSPSEGRAGEGGEAGTSATLAPTSSPLPNPPLQGEGTRRNSHTGSAPRILIWAHSHGGNVLALATNLLGGDVETRRAFFEAARPFFQTSGGRVDFPAWQRVEQLLDEPAHPVRNVALDLVTMGTPIRYGWETSGYAKLLHIAAHRPVHPKRDWHAPRYARLLRALAALDGDFVHQIGIAGSGFPVLPIFWRTHVANRKLKQLIARGVPRLLFKNMAAGSRVHDEGHTELVNYNDPSWTPLGHMFGHAYYTRSRWLPLHSELVVDAFYRSATTAAGPVA
jgi:hypothetical protein